MFQTFARVNSEEGAARADVCGSFSFTNIVYFIERVSGQALIASFFKKICGLAAGGKILKLKVI
jgi:hypothetical protein